MIKSENPPIIDVLGTGMALRLLAQAIREAGIDHVYSKESSVAGCQYVHGVNATWDDSGVRIVAPESEWTPGCLIGVILNNAGIPLSVLGDGALNSSDAQALLGTLVHDGYIGEVTEQAASILSSAQASQDNGNTWGEALLSAIRHV